VPITASATPCFITIGIKFHELAPGAILIPNSCIRWLTEYEITPSMPIPASNRASVANDPTDFSLA